MPTSCPRYGARKFTPGAAVTYCSTFPFAIHSREASHARLRGIDLRQFAHAIITIRIRSHADRSSQRRPHDVLIARVGRQLRASNHVVTLLDVLESRHLALHQTNAAPIQRRVAAR